MINLAGAGVGDRRWTEEYRRLIRSSRVDSTATLATAIAGLPAADRPKALLNSSAVGWYGDTGDRTVEEDAPAGEGFLADVCRVWEAATGPAEDAGVRVVRLRTGLPMDKSGGMLKPMLLPFKLGVAGRLGSGRQWIPWISMPDWLEAMVFLLESDVAGPVNLVGPNPVTNAEFTRELSAAPAPPGGDPDPRRGVEGRPRRLLHRGAEQHPGPPRRAAAPRLHLPAPGPGRDPAARSGRLTRDRGPDRLRRPAGRADSADQIRTVTPVQGHTRRAAGG